jgi:hypothetical protein
MSATNGNTADNGRPRDERTERTVAGDTVSNECPQRLEYERRMAGIRCHQCKKSVALCECADLSFHPKSCGCNRHAERDRAALASQEPQAHFCPTGDHDDCTEMIVMEPAAPAEQSDYVCTHCMREVPENAPCPWCGVGFPSEPAAPATRETVLRDTVQLFVDHVTENGDLDADGCIGLAAWVGGCGECLKRFDAMRAALAADESTPTVETRDAKL